MHLAGDSYCHCRSRLSAMFTGSTGEDLRFSWGIWDIGEVSQPVTTFENIPD